MLFVAGFCWFAVLLNIERLGAVIFTDVWWFGFCWNIEAFDGAWDTFEVLLNIFTGGFESVGANGAGFDVVAAGLLSNIFPVGFWIGGCAGDWTPKFGKGLGFISIELAVWFDFYLFIKAVWTSLNGGGSDLNAGCADCAGSLLFPNRDATYFFI